MPSQPSKPDDIDTKSIISMQELDPSPVTDTPDVESGDYFPSVEPLPQHETGFLIPKLGLRGHRWDTWRTSNLPNRLNRFKKGILTYLTSDRVSKILNLPTNSLLHSPPRQHLPHPTRNPLGARKRALPPAHATSLPSPRNRAPRSDPPNPRPHRIRHRSPQYPRRAPRKTVRRRDPRTAR